MREIGTVSRRECNGSLGQPASMSSGEDEGEEEEINEDTEVEVSEEDEGEVRRDSSDEGSESPCVVRLIDFAHTRFQAGRRTGRGLA